jgi:hypothetical protein
MTLCCEVARSGQIAYHWPVLRFAQQTNARNLSSEDRAEGIGVDAAGESSDC